MKLLLRAGKSREERKNFYCKFLIENHADHHPEWREQGLMDHILKQVELCDLMKRCKPWFLNNE